MKLIGLEFRVGMDNMRLIEVCLVPLQIIHPFPYTYPHGPIANVTLHTSLGDVTSSLDIKSLCGHFSGNIDSEEISKKYEALRTQIEKLHI